jgi:hypothetical protein
MRALSSLPFTRPIAGLVIASALLAAGGAGASTYLVLPDGSGDTPSIEAALRLAVSGDVIELGDGVFTGLGNTALDFGGKQLTLRSRSGNAAACVVDAGAGPAATGRALSLVTGEGAGTAIQGIGFRGGYLADADGAALLLVGSSARIRGCRFSGNSAREGGAVFVAGGAPRFEACTFVGNAAGIGGGALAVTAGAQVAIEHCRFDANSAGYGGAVMADAATLSLEGTILLANSASARGGGIYAGDHAVLALLRCTLAYNEGLAVGGIALATLSSLELRNSIIAFSPAGEAVELRYTSTAAVSCSDLFGNAGGDWTGALAALAGLDGNLSLDPEFCGDAADGDLSLSAGSPCVSPPDCGRMGALGVTCAKRGVGVLDIGSIKQLYGGN